MVAYFCYWLQLFYLHVLVLDLPPVLRRMKWVSMAPDKKVEYSLVSYWYYSRSLESTCTCIYRHSYVVDLDLERSS